MPTAVTQGDTGDGSRDRDEGRYGRCPGVPPRPADEQLANAARQLYHAKRGTLVGKAPVAEMNFAPGSAAPDIDENVPF